MTPATSPPARRTVTRRRAARALTAVTALAVVGGGLLLTGAAAPGLGAPKATGVEVTLPTDLTELGPKRRKVRGDPTTLLTHRGTVFRAAGPTPVPVPPPLAARAWMVADTDTGEVLATHDGRRFLPQASTIKLLTAITALETVPPRPKHRATRVEAGQVCSCAGIKVGRAYTRDGLLAGMLLPSGNDAAETLAGSHPRGRTAFLAAMTATATRIGATDTVVKNASGLTATGAGSSARDLLVFLRATAGSPQLAALTAARTGTVSTRGGRTHQVRQVADYLLRYPDARGKSGYTTPALNTLVVETPWEGRRIGVALLGAPAGHTTSGARALTVWAGTHRDALLPVDVLPPPAAFADPGSN